jgi:REP element-mobilizing transposase RayT
LGELPPRRKTIRLPVGVYGQPGTRAALTLVVDGRRRIFENPELARATLDLLRQQADRDRIGVLAYCLMPDHLHMLVRVDGTVDVIRFLQDFKGKSTRIAWSHGHAGTIWQRSFHDQLLREMDSEIETVCYILANPVRRGLVDAWPQYPFSGSFIYDVDDLS